MDMEHALASQMPTPRAWSECLPLVTLIVISTIAWSVYAWVSWPHHWQSRLMHVALFAPWTLAWHATASGALLARWGWRLPTAVVIAVPVVVALGGEALQAFWRAVGHDPEWRGVAFSMLGVTLAWVLIVGWLWSRRRTRWWWRQSPSRDFSSSRS